MNILIVGGSGGIGLAVVELVLAKHPEATIYATFRTEQPQLEHHNLSWMQLDASNETQVALLAKELPLLNVLINATGLLHTDEQKPEKALAQFNPSFFNDNIAANTIPSILLAKHFHLSFKAKQTSFFISLSAKIGSISDNNIGGWLSYRASKAALNMAIKTIAIEWKRTAPHCCVILFHPGTTDTKLSKPFQRNLPPGQLHSAEVTAKALLELINFSHPEDSGTFVSFNKSRIPW